MANEEITQSEIKQVFDYVREKNKKNGLEQTERIAEELRKKDLPKEAIKATILMKIPEEKFNEIEIREKFEEETLQIIKTIKQINTVIERNFEKIPSETLSSILLSLSQNFQPIIIKIAQVTDTLINEEKETNNKKFIKIAEEIYGPLATKLGLNDFAWKIQDYSFKITNHEGWEKIKKLVNKTRAERETFVEEVKKEVETLLKDKMNVQVTGRPKNFKAIFEKLKKVSFQKINDIYGIRIICNKEKECYEALGYVHSKYEIIPEAFDDYITKPKTSGYKSIHTAVKRGNDIIEIQIRTWEQHLRTLGENYWDYKRIRKDKEFEKELSWERQLIELQQSIGKDAFAKKITGKKIFVFTPKNEAIALPMGATVIDFAFAVHTDIGKKMEKARVNSKFVPIETKLNNLDQVEIITAEKPQLKKNWLNFAVSDKAKTKIKTYFGMKKITLIKKPTHPINFKKIKMAECCHPLPGEDVIGVKTTKRKIVVHKKECKNIQKISKDKLIEIGFEREKGKTEIKITAIDRPGLLSEILAEIKQSSATLTNTNFKIKKTGYAEAIFGIEISSLMKLEHLIEKIEKIPSVQSAERI